MSSRTNAVATWISWWVKSAILLRKSFRSCDLWFVVDFRSVKWHTRPQSWPGGWAPIVVHSTSAERAQQESILQVRWFISIYITSITPLSLPIRSNLLLNHYRVNIPDIYKATYGEICRADATSIDLGRLNKYFYELGRYVAAFDRNGFVGKMIYEVTSLARKNIHFDCQWLIYLLPLIVWFSVVALAWSIWKIYATTSTTNATTRSWITSKISSSTSAVAPTATSPTGSTRTRSTSRQARWSSIIASVDGL